MSASTLPEIILISLGRIRVPPRRRVRHDVTNLAEDMMQVGLLHPITVTRSTDRDSEYTLVAGFHRLEAARHLGWSTIPADVRSMDALEAQLAEISENLTRSELSALERGEHIVARLEILDARGLRAPAHRPGTPEKGATVTPFTTVADVAAELHMSERTLQRLASVARRLPEPVRDALRRTNVANRVTDLLKLCEVDSADVQIEAAELVRDGAADSVEKALESIAARHFKCDVCDERLDVRQYPDRAAMHCSHCGEHSTLDRVECSACGAPLFGPYPQAGRPAPQPDDSGLASSTTEPIGDEVDARSEHPPVGRDESLELLPQLRQVEKVGADERNLRRELLTALDSIRHHLSSIVSLEDCAKELAGDDIRGVEDGLSALEGWIAEVRQAIRAAWTGGADASSMTQANDLAVGQYRRSGSASQHAEPSNTRQVRRYWGTVSESLGGPRDQPAMTAGGASYTCPKCGGAITAFILNYDPSGSRDVTCSGCGHAVTWTVRD